MRKLFLASDTITSELVPYFEELIGKGINGLKAAFIPDAADAIDWKDNSWVDEEMQFLIDAYDWNVEVVRLKDCTNELLKSLSSMDVIFVCGGFSGYLAKVMRESGFTLTLPKLLDSGIVYVGSSGGSMVMSDVQDVSSWFIGEAEPEALNIPGLGYIDFQIYPHFRNELRDEISLHVKPDLRYVLLRDGQAVRINNEKVDMVGGIVEIIN